MLSQRLPCLLNENREYKMFYDFNPPTYSASSTANSPPTDNQ